MSTTGAVTGFRTTLKQSLSEGGSETTITLNSLTTRDSHLLAMSDIGDIGFLIISPGGSTMEIISFTGIDTSDTSNPKVTGVIRGLPFYGVSLSAVSANVKAHGPGEKVIIGTNHQWWTAQYGALDEDETITGYWTAPDPLTAQGLATKAYVDNTVNGGTVSYDRIVAAGIAGETLSAGNLVYLKAADGRWWKADADATATTYNIILGIAQGAGTAGNAITGGVLLKGLDTNNTGTAGNLAYVSNTAGAVGTSAGTNTKVIGHFKPSSGGLYFDPDFYYGLTQGYYEALAGQEGTPSSSNKYLTNDYITYNRTQASTDQTQTTQDATTAVGEADATTKRNKIAQSFTAAKKRIAGVKLYKSADTGSFTGTVTVGLYADSSGSPTGAALASVTISNATWLKMAVGEFECMFTSEYTSLTVGTLYWILVSCSTSDNSNHPNLGTNSAGGYASGSSKYYNTTDGYIAISTIDLYFKTLEGRGSMLVYTNADGKISKDLLGDKMLATVTTNLTLTASLQDFITAYIPAGAVTDNSLIKLKAVGDIVLSGSAISRTVDYAVIINGTTVKTGSLSFNENTATKTHTYVFDIDIIQISTSAQEIIVGAYGKNSATTATDDIAAAGLGDAGTSAIDITATTVVKVQFKLSSVTSAAGTIYSGYAKLFR